MKVASAFREAFRAYFRHFWSLMLTLLVELVLRGVALAPLLFLVEEQTAPLALLCVPLYLLIVLPARQNVALAAQDMLAGGSIFSPRLVSFEGYGRKVLRGLLATLKMLLWCVPLIAGIIVALWATKGSMDGITLFSHIYKLGGNDIIRGLQLLAVIYLLLLVPPVIGCAYHSGTRHAAALGDPRLVKGKHGGLVLLWLLGLVVFVPFVAAAAYPCWRYMQEVIAAARTFMFTFKLDLPDPSATLKVVGILIVVLLLPVIPLRTLLPAAYVRAAQTSDRGAIGAFHAS